MWCEAKLTDVGAYPIRQMVGRGLSLEVLAAAGTAGGWPGRQGLDRTNPRWGSPRAWVSSA